MKSKASPTLIVVMLVSAVPGTVLGQLSREDIEALRERGKVEGWTFTVGENGATRRPIHELSGTVEPPNWRANAVQDARPARRDLPISFDWCDRGVCTPVRDQGHCGSCWAFAATATVESALLINEDLSTDLSEQWLVSCTDAGDCVVGWYTAAYDYLKLGGLQDPCGGNGAVLEEDFPYEGFGPECSCPYAHPHAIFSWAALGPADAVAADGLREAPAPEIDIPSVEQIKQAIYNHGPVAASVRMNAALQAYTGGVFNACEPGTTDHAVVLVGWDDSLGTGGAWIMRNSWGAGWGVNGYMLIEYGCSSVGYGTSYVNYDPQDCNGNMIPDRCDIDCEISGGPCDVPGCGAASDCNDNMIPDECDLSLGISTDYNNDGISDDCEPDCNGNAVPDECDLSCDGNCWMAPGCGQSTDCDGSGVPDECKEDCNDNGVPDICDIINETSDDCQPDGVPDDCQLEDTIAVDLDPCSPNVGYGEAWCDNFEDYTSGSIHGLGGWEGWRSNPLLAGSVTSQRNHTEEGTLSLLVGESEEGNSYRTFAGYDLDTWPYWSVRAWILVPSATVGTSYFSAHSDCDGRLAGTKPGANLRAEPAEGWLYNDLTGSRLPLIIDEWVEVHMLVDLTRDLVTIHYDGQFLDSNSWTANYWTKKLTSDRTRGIKYRDDNYIDIPGYLESGSLQIAAVQVISLGPEGIYVDDLSVSRTRLFSSDCNGNAIPDECDVIDSPGNDLNGNGVPDKCEVPMPDRPAKPVGEAACCANRYISFVPGNPGMQTALRVTLTDLPREFDSHEGMHVWVGQPVEICENSGQDEPPPGGCGPAWVGGPALTMQSANLQANPYCHDFGSEGLIHVTDCEIVPGAAYTVQAIDCASDPTREANYSAPLLIHTSPWGNICGAYDLVTAEWSAPDATIDIVHDVTACVDKFQNAPGAPTKERVDIGPNVPDWRINTTSDVTMLIDAFGGAPYPFPGPGTCLP